MIVQDGERSDLGTGVTTRNSVHFEAFAEYKRVGLASLVAILLRMSRRCQEQQSNLSIGQSLSEVRKLIALRY
jgi:hypothetical protein